MNREGKETFTQLQEGNHHGCEAPARMLLETTFNRLSHLFLPFSYRF